MVYTTGAFDLFHAGHVDFLQACLKFGTYIIIGLHDDLVSINLFFKMTVESSIRGL